MLTGRYGLFLRIAVSVTLFFAIFIAVIIFVLVSDAEKRFYEERVALVSASAKTLANGSRDALITEDYELLEFWLKSVLLHDYYAYAYLSRDDGVILSHTDVELVARKSEPLGKLSTSLTREVTYHGRAVNEIVWPSTLGNNFLANAHVAYYLDQDAFMLFSDINKFSIIAAILLGGLFVIILVIVQKQLKPLTQLTDSITSLSLDALHVNFDKKILQRNDEIGTLAKAYDGMVLRLLSAFNELKIEEDRLQYMVNEKTLELQNSNRELDAFCHSVSHDMRAPLRRIDGFANALLEEYEEQLDETGKNYLTRVINSVEQMNSLIGDMLQLSKISRAEIQRKNIDISQLVTEIVDEHRLMDESRQCEIDIEPGMEAAADLKFIRIAFNNLIENAWKYTQKQPVTIIKIGYDFIKGETVFYVADNGVGFDVPNSEKLFDVFQRFHDESEYPGSGVGLATVKRVILRHGGRIWAESTPGKGATFYLTVMPAQMNTGSYGENIREVY